MKKNIFYKLLILVLLFVEIIKFSYANGQCDSGCKIKDSTPKIILDYIKNNRKIINNISKNLKKSKTTSYNIPSNVNIGINKSGINYNSYNSYSLNSMGLRIYNTLFNWTKVKSGFSYFLSNLDGDVPAPIKRDIQLIDNQNEILNKFLTKVIDDGYKIEKLDPKKICEGIEDSGRCEKMIGTDVEEAIKNLIKNNSTINLIIRKELGFMGFKSVVGSQSYDELFLVGNDFKSKLKEYYNKNTYEACANCKGGSIERIKKAKDKILLNDKESKDGIQQWKDAWDLLIGINDKSNEEYQKLESSLLKEELARQGVSADNSKVVLNNLKNFNNKKFGFDLGNNPITNSFRSFSDAITKPFRSKGVSDFTNAIASLKDAAPDKDIFRIDELNYSKKNLTNDDEIFENINILIKSNMGLIAKQNESTDKLQARIIQLHINLNQTINLLEKIRPKTEKICNDQDFGNGICSYK